MMELLSPAGSPEAIIAAVQNGADAVYLGIGDFNARRGAKNFTPEEFEKAIRYCRVRGCKVHLTLNTLVNDREMESAVEQAKLASDLGADALIVQDLGLVRAIRSALPDIPIHASTQMSIHNLAGVEAAADMGATRAVLARELSFEQIKYITRHASIETEVFAHGALCFCHSGQCYMSAVIGQRSGNRGMCAQPCRLQYSLGGRMDDYPLSLKDNCLVDRLAELEKAGVACVKIEGRAKRPEYSAIVTGIYSRALKNRRRPSSEEMQQLESAFSRDGFTQGYFNGTKKDMHGTRGEPDRESEKLFNAARKAYGDGEVRRVPMHFYTVCEKGKPITAIAFDNDGNKAIASGGIPEKARKGGLTVSYLQEQMNKTGGTPFYAIENKAKVDPGLFLPASEINELRRQLISSIADERAKPAERAVGDIPQKPINIPIGSKPKTIFQVLKAEQLTVELAELKPDYIYVPLMLLAEDPSVLRPFLDNGAKPVAVLPRIITDDEMPIVFKAMQKLVSHGIDEALVGNMGHIMAARSAGMKVRGDFGLNCFNSHTLGVIRDAGFMSATVSFELRTAQIKDLYKPLDTEMIVYGRLPLMVSDQCIISHSAGRCNCQVPANMSDRKGSVFPVEKEFGCRNVIYNAHKLFLAERMDEINSLGLWAVRLMFTNENPRECVAAAKGALGISEYTPNATTKGLYYRGVN